MAIQINGVTCNGKSSKKSRFLPGLHQVSYVSFRRYYPDQVMRVYFSEFFFVISPNIAAWSNTKVANSISISVAGFPYEVTSFTDIHYHYS